MLKGRSVIVTDSTGGIGMAVARALNAKGCDVLLHDLGGIDWIGQERQAMEALHGVKVRYSAGLRRVGDIRVNASE